MELIRNCFAGLGNCTALPGRPPLLTRDQFHAAANHLADEGQLDLVRADLAVLADAAFGEAGLLRLDDVLAAVVDLAGDGKLRDLRTRPVD